LFDGVERRASRTFPNVQVDEQGAEFVAVGRVGVDFCRVTGWGAVLGSIRCQPSSFAYCRQLWEEEQRTYRLRHLLHNPIHNRIAKPLVSQSQPKEIRQRQPHPLAVFVGFVVAVVGVILITMGVVGEEFVGVQEAAVNFESFGSGVYGVKIDR